MATSFDTIIDMAMVSIQDYKLSQVYINNQDDFNSIVDGFLKRGLPMFIGCKKSLDYDITTRTFASDFSPLEISILADLFVYCWLEHNINNITQFQLKMTTNDFKHYSEAENLKQKVEYLDRIREKFSQKITDYGYETADWTSWGNGIF